MHVCARVHMFVHVPVCACVPVCTCVSVCACLRMCVFVHVFVCACVCMHACTCVCVCVCVNVDSQRQDQSIASLGIYGAGPSSQHLATVRDSSEDRPELLGRPVTTRPGAPRGGGPQAPRAPGVKPAEVREDLEVSGRGEEGASSPGRDWDPLTSLQSGWLHRAKMLEPDEGQPGRPTAQGRQPGSTHPSFLQLLCALVSFPHLDSWFIFFHKILTSLHQN